MSSNFDEFLRATLRRAFADRASNVPEFTTTALHGGNRSDQGLENLLRHGTDGAELAPLEKLRLLKRAITEFLDAGKKPSIECSAGDAEMKIDAAVYYHFRIRVANAALFVKVFVDTEDAEDPDVVVISVKRDDRAWK